MLDTALRFAEENTDTQSGIRGTQSPPRFGKLHMTWLVETALRLRVAVVALSILLLILGIRLAPHLPLDVFPEFAPPYVEIQTEAPGLSAEEVENLVTFPLENVLIGLHSHIATRPLDFVRVWGRNRGEADALRRVEETLDDLGITVPLDREVRTLSFVDQRFIEIARALVTHPTLLMLDEPAAGLSPPEVERFAALVRRLRAERNMTILLVEHVIALVMDLCDEVSVLDNGELIAQGEPRQIADDPRVRAAYLGEPAHA